MIGVSVHSCHCCVRQHDRSVRTVTSSSHTTTFRGRDIAISAYADLNICRYRDMSICRYRDMVIPDRWRSAAIFSRTVGFGAIFSSTQRPPEIFSGSIYCSGYIFYMGHILFGVPKLCWSSPKYPRVDRPLTGILFCFFDLENLSVMLSSKVRPLLRHVANHRLHRLHRRALRAADGPLDGKSIRWPTIP